MFCSDDCRSWPREEKVWSDDCRSWPRAEKINNHGCWGKHAHIPDNDYWGICLFHVMWTNLFFCNYSYVVHTEYIFFSLRMRIISPKEFKSCVTRKSFPLLYWKTELSAVKYFAICFLKSAFDRIFNVMQLILVKIKWHIKWKYLIKKFHDTSLSYYFKQWPFHKIMLIFIDV